MTPEEIHDAVARAVERDREITARHIRQLRALFGDKEMREATSSRTYSGIGQAIESKDFGTKPNRPTGKRK